MVCMVLAGLPSQHECRHDIFCPPESYLLARGFDNSTGVAVVDVAFKIGLST